MPLAKPRNTITRAPDLLVIPVAATTVIQQGALVCVDGGHAVPGATAANLTAAGRAEETVDNSDGAAGAKAITIRRGVFKWKNAAADPIGQADLLADCYVVDDETVAKTDGAGTRSKAGKVLDIEPTGVWVETL